MAPGAAFWSGRRVLVTGAGGFIGSHLVEALVRSGANVTAFLRYTSRPDLGSLADIPDELRDEIDVYRGDLANPEALDAAVAGSSVVLALGALIAIPYSYRHPREYVSSNIDGIVNVLEACRRHGVERLVHTSTSEVYGTAQRVPIDEDHPLRAQSPYAATKIAADQLALSYWRTYSTPVVVARPFNTFGPRQSARAVIPTVITQALTRDRIELGSTAPTRDFVFVEDTARGLMRCAEADGVEGEVINLGTGEEISIGDLVQQVLELTSRDLPVIEADERLRPANSEVERLVADASKAAALLGWTPQVPFAEGLRRTVEWMQDEIERYRPADYAT